MMTFFVVHSFNYDGYWLLVYPQQLASLQVHTVLIIPHLLFATHCPDQLHNICTYNLIC